MPVVIIGLSDVVYATGSADEEIRVAAVLLVEEASQLLEAAGGGRDIIVHFAYPTSSASTLLIALRVVTGNSSTHC